MLDVLFLFPFGEAAGDEAFVAAGCVGLGAEGESLDFR